MFGEIVKSNRNNSQLGAYVGPHVDELPSFHAPGEMRATYRRLGAQYRRDRELYREIFGWVPTVPSAFGRMAL
jgi:hypothetical protein